MYRLYGALAWCQYYIFQQPEILISLFFRGRTIRQAPRPLEPSYLAPSPSPAPHPSPHRPSPPPPTSSLVATTASEFSHPTACRSTMGARPRRGRFGGVLTNVTSSAPQLARALAMSSIGPAWPTAMIGTSTKCGAEGSVTAVPLPGDMAVRPGDSGCVKSLWYLDWFLCVVRAS